MVSVGIRWLVGCQRARRGIQIAARRCDYNPHIQESPHPRAPKPPKSLKKVFPGLPARSVKKVSKKSQMTRKRVKKTTTSVHLGLFRHFFDTPGREAREHLFETFWGVSGLGGVETPAYGDCNRNARQCLPLNCCASTLTAGTILEDEILSAVFNL